MDEGRFSKYGRNLGRWINYTIINNIEEEKRESYKHDFLRELKKYSFEPRKRGEPKNSGCVHELEKIVNVDVTNPMEFAKLIKEGIHLMYLKSNSKRTFAGLLEELSKTF